MHRPSVTAVALVLLVCSGLAAQQNASLRAAQQAYQALDYGRAIAAVRRALNERLTREERILAYELLAFAYGGLDSARQAVEAFRELIFLDPDREPDVQRVSPRITSLYASALGQVLVLRGVRVDSTSFIAGQGGLPIRFNVSRPARVVTSIVGPGFEGVIDSQLVAGSGGLRWPALTADGSPIPPGDYRAIVRAVEGRNEYAAQVPFRIEHGAVDTLPHLTSLPGYSELPEMERPARTWRPLGLAVLYAGVAAGAAVALGDPDLGTTHRGGIAAVSLLGVITGFVMSIRQPDPQPVPANIRYNQLLREQLARQNAEIARQNAERRRLVRLTATPVPGASP